MKRIGVGTVTVSEQAKKNVMEVLETGRLSYGPFLKKLEIEFSKIHKNKIKNIKKNKKKKN